MLGRKTTVSHEFGHLLNWHDFLNAKNPASLEGTHDVVGYYENGVRKPGIMTPRDMDGINNGNPNCPPISDRKGATVDLPNFDSKTLFPNGVIDPEARKVTQKDILNVLRNISNTPGTQKI